MGLRRIEIEDVRCIHRAELELDAHLTLITGANGSGKSSLLESMFLLGRGRSFRASRLDTVIRQGADRLRVVGTIVNDSRTTTIGVESDNGGVIARVAGAPVETLANLATAFPVQVIEPGVHKLIEEGPVGRRRYLDWGVFHVEPNYLQHWQRLQRVLKQRNAALKGSAADDILDAFDRELSVVGEAVAEARSRYGEILLPHVTAACERLLGVGVSMRYARGWPEGVALEEALAASRDRDRRRRMSTIGPHRADLVVEREGELARAIVSRGQQKLLAASMVLGQLSLHVGTQGLATTLLLDDPAAELDEGRLQLLVAEVQRLQMQLVMTSLTPRNLLGTPGRTFHVEQGVVRPVI